MATVIHARVTLTDGLTFLDSSSNSFTFKSSTDVDPVTLASSLEPLVEAFYNTNAAGATNHLTSYISNDVSRLTGATSTTWYDVSASLGGPLGPPIETDLWTLAGGGGTGRLPPGVAITLGYRAAYGGDAEKGASASLPSTDQAIDQGAPATHTGITRPRARDRGRIFFGPLNPLAVIVGNDSVNGGTVSTAARTDIGAAFKALCAAAPLATPGATVVVWSRRAAAVKDVAYFYVDEGSTYQRRREDDTVNRVHSWAVVSP